MTEKDARLYAIKALETSRAPSKEIRQEIDSLLCSDVYLSARERSELLDKIDDCLDRENETEIIKRTHE